MRSKLIVSVPPLLDCLIELIQILEPLQIQTLGSQGAIESFHQAILGWFAGLNEPNINFLIIGPFLEVIGDKLWPIITTNVSGFTAPSDHLIQYRGSGLCRNAKVSLCPQCSSRTFIHDIDHAYFFVFWPYDPITDKVHCPALIDTIGSLQIQIIPPNLWPSGFTPQVQLLLLPNAIDLFMVPFHALTAQKMEYQPEAPGNKSIDGLMQLLSNLLIFFLGPIATFSIMISLPTNAQNFTFPTNTMMLQGIHQLFFSSWACHFFSRS